MEVERMRRLLVIVLYLLFVSTCRASTIMVDDDSPADFMTIQAAIDASEEGDTVFVAPGTYTESVRMKHGVNLQGAGAERTVIDGRAWTAVVRAANNCRLDGLTITGYAHEDIDGVYCEDVKNFTISNNIIKSNTWNGVNAVRSSIIISNNLILDNTCAGIFCNYESSAKTLIINNTICGNRNEAGINVWLGAAALVANNIIASNTGWGGIYCSDGGTVTLVKNNVWGNTCCMIPPADYVGCEPGETDISVDPLFADPNNGDYHLESQAGRWDPKTQNWVKDDVTSPCIDAGDPSTRIGLEPFPNGGRVNMGAYGGTAEASKSYFGKPVCEMIVAGDINGDCRVDFYDLAIMAGNWLRRESPGGNQPPNVSIRQPKSGQTIGIYHQDDPIEIIADAYDVDGQVARVEFYADGSPSGAVIGKIGQDSDGSDGWQMKWIWWGSWGHYPEGDYVLTAMAIDNSGAQTLSAGVLIHVHGPK